VNRGPSSAAVVRFVMQQPNAITVLGNHDLHLLAVAAGVTHSRRKDTLGDILDAPDRESLLAWLRSRPLLHHDNELSHTLIHAGLHPTWNLATAQRLARAAEAVIVSSATNDFLKNMYGDEPANWDESLTGWPRIRAIVNCFTRLRYCAADGRALLSHKGPPGSQPEGYLPWFAVPGRASQSLHVIFGHWSTLGLWHDHGVLGLDSGCLWGGRLTAARLDGPVRFFTVDCPASQIPG
jgi:bis(5'-nucleosyl)-tetraphosphatase (symmetrical)